MKLKTLLPVLALSVTSLAQADFANFDFEEAPGNDPGSVELTSLEMMNSGLTATLFRDSGEGFGIVDSTVFIGSDFEVPASYGTRSLDPSGNVIDDWFVINFSQDIQSFYIEFGDFGQDSDDIFLEGYGGLNASGSLLASSSFLGYTGNMNLDGDGESISITLNSNSLNTGGFNSVRFRGGSQDFPQTLYWDNIEVGFEPVPEPATMTILALGTLAALRRRIQG